MEPRRSGRPARAPCRASCRCPIAGICLVTTAHSISSEVKAVAVLALGFGLVGVDRFLISTMFPVIARDLHLGYGDIGTITGVLAIAWGIAALLMGNLADRIG